MKGVKRVALIPCMAFGIALLIPHGVVARAKAPKRPAIMVHAPRGQGWVAGVDVEFLKELKAAGLEVDYTDRHTEFTWDRIKNYNVLVLYTCPGPEGSPYQNFLTQPNAPHQKEFVELVERFLAEGGGVFLMAYTHNVDYQYAKALTDNWSADLPLQWIEETNASNIGHLTRIRHSRLSFTDHVFDSPVSDGVRQIWRPYGKHYLAGVTGPLVLGPEWTVVVRASKTARTVPIATEGAGYNPPANVTKTFPTAESPPIFAVRDYRKGRIALCSMWPVFTFTSGKQWLFHSDVLTNGFGGKPSHFQKLIENSLKWLGKPSLASGALGGYVTDPSRLLYTNERPEVKRYFEEVFWGEKELSSHRPPRGRLFKGLIGAKTIFSGAKGTPADYAHAAKDAGLDFVVVLDDFAKLTETKFEELKKTCSEVSDEDVLVIPGYTIDNNIGNHMFIYSLQAPWPREQDLYGPNKSLLKQQFIDEEGNYQRSSPVLVWILHDVQKKTVSQIGYFNFQDSPQGIRMEHGRTFGMGVLWYYENGQLVEDVTDNYLVAAEGCVPPGPGVIDIVRSPDELKREVAAGRGILYAQARSLATLQQDALAYASMRTYDAPNIFPSTGPVIHKWPECWRVHTFAVEDFVTGRNLMPSPIHVTSDVGLKEVAIYDGTALFRRFLLNGEKEFKETLFLNGTVQMNLVLIAEDVKGGKAVSYARRTRKVGDVYEYCGDRVNVGDMFMFHGPGMIRVLQTPAIFGGYTWDGGPEGVAPLVAFGGSHPMVTVVEGSEGQHLHNQNPMLVCSDEGVRAMNSVRDQVFPDYAFHRSMNPWGSYGPLVDPKLFTHVQQYVEWHNEPYKVRPAGHAGYGYGYGAVPTLFTTRMTFVNNLNIQGIRLLRTWGAPPDIDVHVVAGIGKSIEIVRVDQIRSQSLVLKPGDWFGVYSPKAANSNIFAVRDTAVRVDLKPTRVNTWLMVSAEPAERKVKAGDTFTFSLASMTFPVDSEIDSTEKLMRRKVYLDNPTDLKVTGATRLKSPGLLDYETADGHIEIELPNPGWDTMLTLPFRLRGFNPRWSVGLFMKRGFVTGYYGKGEDRYRPLGVDSDGQVYIPMAPDLAPVHHYVAGHPVTAAGDGAADLFIQVTQVSGGTFMADKKEIQPFRWHVSVNNPLDRAVTVTVKQNFALPGLQMAPQRLTLQPGQYTVLVQ